jgi:TatA/E family protein of Tat protein translocase
MFDVGGGELLLILVVILLLFGPKKIPEFMQAVGKGVRQFKRAQEDLTEQLRDLSTAEPPARPTIADQASRPAVADGTDAPDATNESDTSSRERTP